MPNLVDEQDDQEYFENVVFQINDPSARKNVNLHTNWFYFSSTWIAEF